MTTKRKFTKPIMRIFTKKDKLLVEIPLFVGLEHYYMRGCGKAIATGQANYYKMYSNRGKPFGKKGTIGFSNKHLNMASTILTCGQTMDIYGRFT